MTTPDLLFDAVRKAWTADDFDIRLVPSARTIFAKETVNAVKKKFKNVETYGGPL